VLLQRVLVIANFLRILWRYLGQCEWHSAQHQLMWYCLYRAYPELKTVSWQSLTTVMNPVLSWTVFADLDSWEQIIPFSCDHSIVPICKQSSQLRFHCGQLGYYRSH